MVARNGMNPMNSTKYHEQEPKVLHWEPWYLQRGCRWREFYLEMSTPAGPQVDLHTSVMAGCGLMTSKSQYVKL